VTQVTGSPSARGLASYVLPSTIGTRAPLHAGVFSWGAEHPPAATHALNSPTVVGVFEMAKGAIETELVSLPVEKPNWKPTPGIVTSGGIGPGIALIGCCPVVLQATTASAKAAQGAGT
jgi:hypothetical protein